MTFATAPLATPDLLPNPPHGVQVLGLVGNTPLIVLRRVAEQFPAATVAIKAEWFNPGGSVKDRPATNIMLHAIKQGLLTPEKSLLDATSGNTGIAYAMVGAALGYKVTLCLPANASPERKKILRAYGAELVITSPLEGSDGAILKARELHAAHPERYYYADQYSNPHNWQAHYHTTGVEIWRQSDRQVTHFVAGLGTSGTFVGTSRRLKEFNPAIQCLSFQPDGPMHGLEGMKHLPSAIVPEIYDPSIADGEIAVATEEAHAMCLRLAREEGLLVGVSAAAAVVATLKAVEKAGGQGFFVTICPDNAFKYLSEEFWSR